MATFKIRKADPKSQANVKRATDRMDWRGFVIAGDQRVNNRFWQDGFQANLESSIEDDDVVVEVDEEGEEIDRAVF